MVNPDPPQVVLSPLLPNDPAQVSDFWLDARLTAAASGVAYVAHDAEQTQALLIMLSEGAAGDAAARDRLAGAVNQLHIDTVLARGGDGQDSGRLGNRLRTQPDAPDESNPTPITPWVALRYDGSPQAVAEANRILSVVQMDRLEQLGKPAGPGFRLPWIDRFQPGLSRLWPLPWPGRHDRAGALSILASWLLMLLLAALAILIAILLFQQSPPMSPPPPLPPTAPQSVGSGQPQSPDTSSPSPSDQSGSPSPSESSSSPSPSESSGSPQPSSGSPSPSESGASPTPSQSGSGSPTPSESSSGIATPTQNSRL